MSLFPRTVLNDRLHTFSAYERMSTALTARSGIWVQRLCAACPLVWRRYPALMPQESNQRLAQITPIRSSACGSPSVINTRAREQLAEGGLAPPGYPYINQIIRVLSVFRRG